MRKKYIIQIYRSYLWEDLVTYYDERYGFSVLTRLRLNNPNSRFRLVEVFFIC